MKEYIENMNYNNEMLGMLILIGTIFIILTIVLVIALIRKNKREKHLSNIISELKTNYKELELKNNQQNLTLDDYNNRAEELTKSRDTLRNIAYTDKLTSLPNYNAYIDMLDNIMLTIRQEEIIAVMCIDLDDFKQINDSLGQSYGDELLLDITHRIKQVLDENDYFARIGGDEFVVVTQNTVNTEEYEEKIKKIRNVFSYPFNLSTTECFVNISIGAVFAPKDGKNSKVLTRNLYAAMHVSKLSGKNTYNYYDKSFNDVKTEKIEFQSEIRNAIQNKEFELLYQPILDLTDNKIVAFEALIRWNHPSKGLILPEHFINEAEDNGLIIPIGNWVIKTACDQLKQWHDSGHTDISVAVNISPRQFKEKSFVQTIHGIISETGIDPSKLELEITEKLAMKDTEKTLSCIRELQELGIVFSLDDFGTGYSSVNYLRVLPIQNLKIDIVLIQNLFEDSRSKMIVGAIITLGKYMGFSITAEGIESAEQEEFLKSIKCNKGQGYLYSEPVKASFTHELLKK
ncbi:MAG TPA: EAL domain-containing protein [Clostridiales bacterium]|nr:EAL domain-containing protein [Clostridiales bacterium]